MGEYIEQILHPAAPESLDLWDLTTVDAPPGLTDKAAQAQKIGSRCITRAAFTGTDKALDLMIERFGKYDLGDMETDYAEHLTTLSTGRLLPSELWLLSHRATQSAMKAWFVAHQEALAPEMRRLARHPKHGKFVRAWEKIVGA